MGCSGHREKGPPEHTQKWAFITLSDFTANSFWSFVAYIWLWTMALVAVAVYTADTFTAVNLLAFDKWSSQIQPAIAFKYSKWIFAACIFLSWALCLYEWIRAIRVIKRGGVAQSYMDPLSMKLQSMRPQGWKRFLVFTELTKSKKGADYVAFFVYFGFNGALRIILAEGPRQFVNAMTLYSVMQADLLVKGTTTSQYNSFEQFFLNVEALAAKNTEQVVILFSMLFTLIIWVFSALSLIIAAILYLAFLWHYIPQSDGRLSIYCRRKIDRRLEKIVEYKVKAAIEEEQRRKDKAEKKAELKRQKTGELPLAGQPAMVRQPTLPQLGVTPEMPKSEKMQEFGLSRKDTSTSVSTLPQYESRPPTRDGSQQLHRQPSLPDYAESRPGMPSRMGTQGSAWSRAPSYDTDAPLLSNAGFAGGRDSPAPPMPPPAAFERQGSNASFGRPMPGRSMTQGSQATQRPYAPINRLDTMGAQQQRPFSPMSQQQQRPYSPMSQQGSVRSRPPPEQRGPPVRSNTGFSYEEPAETVASPLSMHDDTGRLFGPITRQGTQDTFRTAPVRQTSQASSFARPTYGSMHSQQRSFSRPIPPPGPESYEMSTHNPSGFAQFAPATASSINGNYRAFSPDMVSTSGTPTPQLQHGPRRNITVAGQPGMAGNYFGQVRDVPPQRSATAPIADNRLTTGYADILDDYDDNARRSVSPPIEDVRVLGRPTLPFGGVQGAQTSGPADGGWQPPHDRLQRAHTAEPTDGDWQDQSRRF